MKYGLIIFFALFLFFVYLSIGGWDSIRSFIDSGLDKAFSDSESQQRRITSALEARHREDSERIYDFTKWKDK